MSNKFVNLLKSKKPVLFDGAMGTMLIEYGIELSNMPPEILNVSNPAAIKKIHKAYIDSGSDVITTNTFGANRYKLGQYGMSDKVYELCYAGVKIAKEAAGKNVCVAASIGPIGKLLSPLGKMDFDDAVEIYAEMVKAFDEVGADLIIIETMLDLHEARAALFACRENTDIPIVVMMTFEGGARSATGTPPEAAAAVLSSLGACAVGMNCSSGPDDMAHAVKKMADISNIPIIAQANAGTPIQKDGKTIFPLNPEDFAGFYKEIIDQGASIIGGCCGTTPEHIRALKRTAQKLTIKKRNINPATFLASRSKLLRIDKYPVIVGERINPNALKMVAQSVHDKEYSFIIHEAESQTDAGADILDVNVSVPNVDEPEIMRELVSQLSSIVNTPLCIDSPSYDALEAGLRAFPGRALVNSTNGEKERYSNILPLVKKYGAAVICLTMDENGIPETVDERVRIAERVIKECDKIGIQRKDIFVDTLTLTISTEPQGAVKAIEAMRIIKEKFGVRGLLGISNISFGLPGKEVLNAGFLGMAVGQGLDAAIMNPKNKYVRNMFAAGALLRGSDKAAERYLAVVTDKKEELNVVKNEPLNLRKAIIKGVKSKIAGLVEKELESKEPLQIINDLIIPALDEVGGKYDKGEFFLPQLLFAAEAAEAATKIIQEKLISQNKEASYKATILFATVKGDLHDIGKNIVISVLKNYGYKIIDLGKNADSESIIKNAEKYKADIIALSALMTTSMKEMEKLIIELKEKGLRDKYKIIIGGAVVNKEYAERIQADGYAKDPIETVNLLKKMYV
ncbi:MAG: homocysteine S-methyltransferase family protein [Elusimicrobiota bacterium]